ncbi:MAG TPA: aerial mycelium formation protein [Mycobacteriales bacterium]|nr:aerial mycelium formation protein [Mycobacteriales bacterium]
MTVAPGSDAAGAVPSTRPAGAPTGNRRIDRVLAEDFLDGLSTASLAQVRGLRAEAEQEETDLSYLRRMVQGRIDIVRADLERRGGAGDGTVLDRLASILAEERRAPARGLGRHAVLEPSRADEHRRYVERLVADVDLTDVSSRSDDELRRALEALVGEEEKLSAKRREVQRVMDACSAEITRRYRDGEADVSSLLGAG